MELLGLADGSATQGLGLVVGQDPSLRARRGGGLADSEGLCLSAHAELHDVVHVVGAEDAYHGHLLALCVDDQGAHGSLEGCEVTDGLTVLPGEESVAAGYERAVLGESFHGEDRLRSLLHPAGLGQQGSCCHQQQAYYSNLCSHNLNSCLAFWMAASEMSLPLSIWAISLTRSPGASRRMRLMVP